MEFYWNVQRTAPGRETYWVFRDVDVVFKQQLR